MNSTVEQERKKRLIVLLPDCLAENKELAHKVYWMAFKPQYEVLYLVLVDNDENMFSISRDMVTMRAVTAGNCLVVQQKLAKTSVWFNTLRELYQSGDRIVCHEEQWVKNGFLKTIPVSDFLHNTFDAPLITISGYYHPQHLQVKRWLHNLVAWLGFLLIMTAFTMLEFQLDPLAPGTVGKILLGILVFFEIGVIWVWDTYIGH